ncbi:DUF6891 domain-containing protein [Sphingobium limneticum]|uniref:DUF6891 domain-containing protein n=1 Tax=Sphingobium limneticum TaxID=1007511 RepID=A0A5J5I620_9SPHN|nr:hypothetical protein [Sphingobium limneticum]KAA9018283.1 hypothetical protein F4U96_09230 [Sphingobium limneticum]KAA9030919.1 hypothetical protein F4U95_09180 [Sphingobium limneticum]
MSEMIIMPTSQPDDGDPMWLTADVRAQESANMAIMSIAEVHFREHGADDFNLAHLTDVLNIALMEVQAEEAWHPKSAAVERAFNRLRINGYRCEQDWQCCRTCGWAAIPCEDADLCVWYHGQDLADAVATGELMLMWQGDAAMIRDALEAEGITVIHDGTIEQRIRVRFDRL